MANLTGYELSRDWFNWCFENPDLVKPIHTALYFFSIEHCNRLGWKEKFGLPTQMTMDALGVKNWRTYSKAFNDIESWGFFKVIERSKNQYSATVIAIVKNTKANTKALSKATQSHSQKHYISIVGIDKQYIEPITDTEPINLTFIKIKGEKIFLKPSDWVKENKENAVNEYMMKNSKGVELGEIFSKFDSEYTNYDFKDYNHIFNSFKSSHEKLLKEKKNGKQTPMGKVEKILTSNKELQEWAKTQ